MMEKWLEQDDERRNMSDREILDKYVDLQNLICQIKKRNKSWICYINKRTHSVLRDKIGTCPNIEVEIDGTDKSPFFIRPYHVKEEDKNILDREVKRLCYLGFSAYSSPIMLISRKVTKDQRDVRYYQC